MALKAAAVPLDEITAGIVGEPDRRASARDCITREFGAARFIEADAGWEQVTIRALADRIMELPGEAAVLYAHTKGAYNADEPAVLWRRSMTAHLVYGWRDCVRLLGEYDAVGCHWLTADEHPGRVVVPFFGGNFWWARASYLRALPPVGTESRYAAEGWVGLGCPRVHDLQPGWPTPDLFERLTRRPLAHGVCTGNVCDHEHSVGSRS